MEYLKNLLDGIGSLSETQLFFIIALAAMALTAYTVKSLTKNFKENNNDSED